MAVIRISSLTTRITWPTSKAVLALETASSVAPALIGSCSVLNESIQVGGVKKSSASLPSTTTIPIVVKMETTPHRNSRRLISRSERRGLRCRAERSCAVWRLRAASMTSRFCSVA